MDVKSKKIGPRHGTAVVWPSGVEERYGISAPTRWRWEKKKLLPPRDVSVGGKDWLAAGDLGSGRNREGVTRCPPSLGKSSHRSQHPAGDDRDEAAHGHLRERRPGLQGAIRQSVRRAHWEGHHVAQREIARLPQRSQPAHTIAGAEANCGACRSARKTTAPGETCPLRSALNWTRST